MSEIKKMTPFQIKTAERNKKIRERYDKLIQEGYAKTQAYKVIQEEFDFYSIVAIQKIIKKTENE